MIGASSSPSSPVAAARALAAAALLATACAGGDPGVGSGNPFGSAGGTMGSTSTGQPTGTDSGSGAPTTGGGQSDSNSDSNASTDASSSSGTGTTTTGVDSSSGSSGDPDPDCIDVDGDGHGLNCDAGPDCDDNNYNAHESCDTCVDADMDGYWVGCDQYGQDAPGPDCDDNDPDAQDGMDCDCPQTPDDQAADSCMEGAVGSLGKVGEGDALPPIKGSISGIDNGPGNGQEDWYWVEFPEAMANGLRPNAGRINVKFTVNPGDPADPDYRFEIYPACGQPPWEGLGAKFGAAAPPATEWEFFDQHIPPNPNPNPNPNYVNNVPWPSKVFIRVIRVKNNLSCSEYVLQVSRMPT